MVAIPEQGRLEEMPLARLLLDLHRARFEGTLELRRERMQKTFLFQEGVPVFAESNLASETLGVQLMDAGKLSREDHARVSRHLAEKRCKEGKALLDLGLIEPKALFLALKDQVRQRIVDCFGWPQGNFRVMPSESVSREAQPFRADVFALVQEGIETHWAADRVLGDLAPRMQSRVTRTRRLSRLQDRLRSDESVEELIDALDGTRTLWRALQTARTPRALAAAWVLDAAGALAYGSESSDLAAGGSGERAIEILLSEQASPASAASPRAAPQARSQIGAEDNALRAEIESRFAALDELDHYALLGVESQATTAAIRRAYHEAARRYHPDSLARAGLEGEVRAHAGKVFAAISRAQATLVDPARRREYDASRNSDESDIDAERLAAAETNYRKGEILMRQGNFRGALDYLRGAAESWPEEAAYQAALGWTLFKKTPSEPEQARVHLERACALAPQHAQSAVWLATVLKALGETVASSTLLAKARALDPDIK
jgi:tetratricopeptide (TPR) repeat protein